MSGSIRVGIVYHGNQEARDSANLAEGRFAGIAAALSAVGAQPVAAVYNDDFAADFLSFASELNGLLVWVNPITEGRDRTKLDSTLQELAKRGVFVSAHPDVILRMGTKQVLFDTKDMAWGSDVRVYRSLYELEEGLKKTLADGRARVLKQYRGHSGGGIWKVQLADASQPVNGGSLIKYRHAERGSVEQTGAFEDVLKAIFSPYFENGGRMIDQEYQERLTDGMIRCYLVIDKVEGFGHQAINALYPAPEGAKPEEAPQPGPRLYHPPDSAGFQSLKRRMEDEFLPELMTVLKLDREQLPLLWDADFLFGPKDADGNDTYVLCEINVSSVSPFPEWAQAPLAKAMVDRLSS
jgi:hypothetical protein